MAAHPTFLAFERRWQLPVYFQLRWKDIVTRLEDSLSTNKLEPESSLKKGLSAVRFDFWDADTDNDDDENSRDQPFLDVLVSCCLVGNDNVLGPERLCATARTSLLEADVADTKSLSYLDSEQPPTVPTRPWEAPPGQREGMIHCSDLCQLLSESSSPHLEIHPE